MLIKISNKILSRLAVIKKQIMIRRLFISQNRSYWEDDKNENKKRNKKVILVEISEKNPFELESNMRVSKTIEENNGGRIVVLLSSFLSVGEPYYKLAKSYSVFRVILFERFIFRKSVYFLKSLIEAINLYRETHSLEDIEQIIYKKILIGDLIYDTYIRLLDKGYSPKKDFYLFKLIVQSLLKYKMVNYIFETNDVEYLVVADKCYIKHGILYRVAIEKGVKVLMPTKELKLLHKDNINTHFYHPELSLTLLRKKLVGVNYKKELEEYFQKRFSGAIDQIDVVTSYRNKKVYSEAEVIDLLDLDRDKKNVVIMPHAFSDFPHVAEGLFSDYYVWLVELLKIVRVVDNVNWIIKPHPTSYFFNETGAVENLLVELKVKNVKIVPEDLNTSSIKDFADIILTVRGTAGLEFATFGIPVVTAGKGCYSGYGLDIEPVSKLEYRHTIANLDRVDRLTEEKIDVSRILFHYLFIKKNAKLNYLMDGIESNLSDYTGVLLNIVNNNKIENIRENILYKETLLHLSA